MKRTGALLTILIIPFFVFQPFASNSTQAQSATLTFAVIGDYGMDNAPESNVASMVAAWSPELIIATGDDYYSTAGGSGSTRYDESTGA